MIFKRNFSFLSKSSRKIKQFDIFSKNGHQLSQTIRLASKKGYNDSHFWNLVKTRFQYVYKSLNARNLSFIANGFSRANLDDNTVWESIVSRSYELSDTFDCQDLALLFNSLCKIESIDAKVFNFFIEEIKKRKDEMNPNPRYASMIIYSLGRIKIYDQELMESLYKSIENNMEQMSLISISNLVNGMYQLNKYNLKLMVSLIEFIKKNMEEISKEVEMKTIVSIYQGYSYSGIYDKSLYNILFDYMINNSSQFKVLEMIILANCMNRTKLHNEKLIGIMNKKLINKPKSCYLDELAMYLSGLLNVKYVPKDEIGRLLDLVSYKKFKGNLNKKNSMVFLQVYSKLCLKNEILSKMLVENLVLNLEGLTQNELANIICCCNSIDLNSLKMFVEQFFKVIDMGHVDVSQHLSRVLYSLSKLSSVELVGYVDELIRYLNSVEIERFEPVNVTNVLFSMESIQESPEKNSLVDRMNDYLKGCFDKFSNQLLASCLGSLSSLGRVEDEVFYKLCKSCERFENHKSIVDNIRILKYLNNYNYFGNFTESEILEILKCYNIVVKNVEENIINTTNITTSSGEDSNSSSTDKSDEENNNLYCESSEMKDVDNDAVNNIDNNKNNNNELNKMKLSYSEEEVVQEARNIIKMLECRLGVKNKGIFEKFGKEGRYVVGESQINM